MLLGSEEDEDDIIIELQDCVDYLCGYMVYKDHCSDNVLIPYPKPLPDLFAGYVFYTPEFKEPHFLFIFDGGFTPYDTKDENGKTVSVDEGLMITGASFSHYRDTGYFNTSEIGFELFTAWKYIGPPSCPVKK